MCFSWRPDVSHDTGVSQERDACATPLPHPTTDCAEIERDRLVVFSRRPCTVFATAPLEGLKQKIPGRDASGDPSTEPGRSGIGWSAIALETYDESWSEV